MRVKSQATIEDLYGVPEKAELVDGEIVVMSPTGYAPARASLQISLSLMEYEQRTGLGRTLPDNTGFIVNLPCRKSFSPDVGFYTGGIEAGVDM